MNIVIAGTGVAGITAAEKARQENPKAQITIFGREPDLFYYRPGLPELVSGKITMDRLELHPKTWYDSKNLELRIGESLLAVSSEHKEVRGSLGSRLSYDRLLLATGAESVRLPLTGSELNGIFAIRSTRDAWELSIKAKKSKVAVLMGAGLLGLEIGFALTQLGVTVKVLERFERILPAQTTPASSIKLQKKLESLGFEFYLQSGVEKLSGKGSLEEVSLVSGEKIPAELLVMAAGISPNLDLARDLGLHIERGIVVDDYLQTSIPGIYAAGDCAQTPDGRGGLWNIAKAEGLVAGVNLANEQGQRQKYVPQPPSSVLKVAGIDLVAAGNLDPEDKLNSAVAETDDTYRKVVVDEKGLLVGFTSLGTTGGNKELGAAIGKKIIDPSLLSALKDPGFDFGRVANLPLI